MSDSNNTMFQVNKNSGATEDASAKPALKSWTTPRVITGTLAEDTEGNNGLSAESALPS